MKQTTNKKCSRGSNGLCNCKYHQDLCHLPIEETIQNQDKESIIRYKRIQISIFYKILNYLKDGRKKVLDIQCHCRINSRTWAHHSDFLVNMEWIKRTNETRFRFIEITKEGQTYQEKICKKYGHIDKEGHFDSYR